MKKQTKLFYRRKMISRGYEFVTGEIVGDLDGLFVVYFEEVIPCTDDQVDLYFLEGDEFMQQHFLVETVCESSGGCHLTLKPDGAPTESGFRRAARVSTRDEDITLDMAGEEGLKVLDVSETGLSVLARQLHVIGSIHDVQLHFNRLHLGGTISIRTVMPSTDDGWFRYGLRCEQVSTNTGLMRMLPKIAVALMVKELAATVESVET